MQSRFLCWALPLAGCLTLLVLPACGGSDDGGSQKSASKTVPFDADGDGQPDGSYDGQCLQVCSINGSSAPVILPENDADQPPPQDPGQDPNDPNMPPPPPPPSDDAEVLVCKKFCAPEPGCMLMCTTGPGAPECKFKCKQHPTPPPPPCVNMQCDKQCIEQLLNQGVDKKDVLAQCCQGADGGTCEPPLPPEPPCDDPAGQCEPPQPPCDPNGNCPPPEPPCGPNGQDPNGQCEPPQPPCDDPSGSDCQPPEPPQPPCNNPDGSDCQPPEPPQPCNDPSGSNCQPPQPPPPPPCGGQCDQQCMQDAMAQGLSPEELQQKCCQQPDPSCQPPEPPAPPQDDCFKQCENACANGDQDKCGQCLQGCTP